MLLCIVALVSSFSLLCSGQISNSGQQQSISVVTKSISLNETMNYKVSEEAGMLKGQELVDYVNRNQNLWTAELNPKFNWMAENDKRKLMGVKHVSNTKRTGQNSAKSRYLDIELPTNFDAREKWHNCQSIKDIHDQSMCGSCWAFGAVEAMSDRICIASGGRIQVTLSAADLLSCCIFCGDGCHGGYTNEAWFYWVDSGLVTGSNYTNKQGCKPYPFAPCEWWNSTKTHYPACGTKSYPTPKCEKKCQASYNKTYNEDKFYGRNFYRLDNDTQAIQKELYTNGPIEVAFYVYSDFVHYKSGIYFKQAGHFYGLHAVKLIGWGEENGVPFWTLANSWNTDWGENGFFRIIRGKNECRIESFGIAGMPDLKRAYFQ